MCCQMKYVDWNKSYIRICNKKEIVEKENTDLKLRLGTQSEDIARLTQDNGSVKAHLELKLLKQRGGIPVEDMARW